MCNQATDECAEKSIRNGRFAWWQNLSNHEFALPHIPPSVADPFVHYSPRRKEPGNSLLLPRLINRHHLRSLFVPVLYSFTNVQTFSRKADWNDLAQCSLRLNPKFDCTPSLTWKTTSNSCRRSKLIPPRSMLPYDFREVNRRKMICTTRIIRVI